MIFTLTAPLTFGKYKGAKLKGVIEHDVEYTLWAVDNIPWFQLDDEAEKYLLHVMRDVAHNIDNRDWDWWDMGTGLGQYDGA